MNNFPLLSPMKMKMLFIAVVAILLTNTIVLSQQCFAATGTFNMGCLANRHSFNARSNLVPSPGRTLTVYVSTVLFGRLNGCNAVTGALVTIGDPRSATGERRLASILYNFDTQELLWAQDTIVGVLMRSPLSLEGRQVNGAISIDLSTGNIRYGVWSIVGIASHGVTVADILQIATFDSSTMFYFCNWNLACCGNHQCTVVGTGVTPNYVEDHRALALMDIPIQIGSFQFLEGTGFFSSSSVAPGLTAQFGNTSLDQVSSPRWMNPGPGLNFTSTNQSMTISGIDGSARSPNVGFSSGISVWINVQGVPPQTILRFRTAQSTADEGIVTLTNTRAIQTTWLGNTVTSNLTVQQDVWTHVVIIMNSASPSGANNCLLRMYFGLTDVGLSSTQCRVPASTTYSLTAGGFVGQMQDLLIFRAPAGFVSSPSCAPRPVIALGSNPDNLLVRSTCPNGIPTRSVCSSCSAVCTTCIDAQQCLTCMPGFFLDATSNSCRQCPISRFALTRNARTCDGVCQTGCGVCLDSSTCRSCLPGFALRDGECFRCGVGTFAVDGTSSLCNEACPATCLTCTSRTECQSCREGLALINGMCVSCPRGTYLESSVCRSCPNSCADCSRGPSTCDSCQEGHVLVNGKCETCPAGTFADATVCRNCPSSCTSCRTSSICTGCQEGHLLVGDQCLACPSGTFSGATFCERCPSLCTNCRNSSVCTGCQEGLALIDGQCVTCPSGAPLTATSCEKTEIEGEVINDDDKPLGTSDTGASNGSVIAIVVTLLSVIVIAVVISVVTNYLKRKELNGKDIDITNESQIQTELINSNINSIKPKALIAL